MASSRRAEGREVPEEEEAEKEAGEVQKKDVVDEMQRVHHKSFHDENEERQNGEEKQKK